MKTPPRRALLFASVLLLAIGCDHAAKGIARTHLEHAGRVSLAADLLRFELVSNPGAFLSLGAGLAPELRRGLFLGLVPALVAGLCVATLRAGLRRPPRVVGLALVSGGGLANWLDRLVNEGAVTDFVSLGLGALRTGIFNLADVAILAGAALLLLSEAPRVRDPSP